MTIQELRQHQILVQDPEIDRTEYDAVMGRLREFFWEDVWAGDDDIPKKTIVFDDDDGEWMSLHNTYSYIPALTFDQFMNLEIETE